jgi:diguanylate cyclase (GGDEF)-like protein/PAS domain S-box-containing protein
MANEKIFITESDSAVTHDIASKLKTLGYTVIGQSEDGDASAHQIAELLPDLVLVDLHLKSPLTGIDLAKKIHTDFDIPVIFISSSADTRTLQSALPAQAYGLVNKPFEIHDLKSSIILSLYKHSMNRKLRESEERYALALRAANDGIWDWNIKTNQIHYSVRWKEMLGLRENGLGNNPEEWFDLIHPDDRASFHESLDSHLKGSTPHFESEYRIKHNNGEFLWVISRGVSVRDIKGMPYRMVGSQSDITARKLVEERLAYDALHDSLTGLPNRVLFLDRLQNRVERTKRNPNNIFAVMFIDLDRFKVVNDSLGHATGDQLLVTVAQRIKQCLRPEDTVSRLSGDEFAILLDSINDVNDSIQVADRIKSKLITTTVLGAIERSPTASIGIVIFNTNYTTSEEILRDADSAMYHAKSKGGNQYQIFDRSMLTSAVQLIQLEGELKRAVQRKEWLCYYQPIFSLVSGKPVGAEALLRWQHPYRGILLPKEFINVAEETGAIVPIGEYILRDACKQAKIWRESHFPRFYVSVNLSARQFQDDNLVSKIEKIIHEAGLPGDGLRLEITENIAVKNTEHTKKVLKGLEELGIRTSIDDFGTGYSSLSYLKNFPLNVLKIDQSFVQDLQMNEKNKSLVIAILSMARSMGLEVVAEGVEKDEQLNFLRAQSCDNVQGFLLSHPLPASEFSKIFNL